MKKTNIFFSLLLTSFLTYSQTPCNSGFAGAYPCNNIDLQSHLSLAQLGAVPGQEGNDIWGWTDPLNGKEYALVGLTSHTAFVDITNPTTPVYLGKLPTATVNSLWRDIKVYNNHAFIVSEASGHGMQVFDLTKLRNVVSPPQTFTADANYLGFGKCHNIAIDEVNGYAYAIGYWTYSATGNGTRQGGPHIINIQNPTAPVFVTEFNAQGYTHDAQIVVYNGPDIQHTGKQIFLGANEDRVVILDVTNKNNISLISTFNYSNTGYTHQGWLTENQNYFLLGDETDESSFFFNTKTIVVDLSDLDNPILKTNYFGTTAAIDHNGYVKGNDFYLANYRAGLRLVDITDIDNGNLSETGFFDTYPTSNSRSFNGAWSVYPYFASGNIIISDIESGLFVVKKGGTLNTTNFEKNSVSIFPNPSNDAVTVKMDETINSVEINSLLGETIASFKNINALDYQINVSSFAKGVYLMTINGNLVQKLIVK